MDEFLTLDRMEGNLRSFTFADCSPAEILKQVAAEFSGNFSSNRIEVRQVHLPEQIRCDAALLRLALNNLVANALRYSPTDKPVRITAKGLGSGSIQFAVEDEGRGIPADEIPKLFDKYFRGRAAKTLAGAGLGLYLVERTASLHGGSIELKSAPGTGSRFILTLPGKAAPAS
jgi:signal transduction histidine kinase